MTQDDSVGPVGATYFVSVLPNFHLPSEGEKFESIVIGEDPILEYIHQRFPFRFVFLSPQFCDIKEVTSSIKDLPNMAICKK
jgi:hypothetical protein